MPDLCPSCNKEQWSVADRRYINFFGCCWLEDKIKVEMGELTEEEFKRREKTALTLQ